MQFGQILPDLCRQHFGQLPLDLTQHWGQHHKIKGIDPTVGKLPLPQASDEYVWGNICRKSSGLSQVNLTKRRLMETQASVGSQAA